MENRTGSEPSEAARAEYDAPRAQRLNDAARARGEVCQANGSDAGPGCDNGGIATSCDDYGNRATEGCMTGDTANECGDGNAAR